jgi:hypothetical protein
MVSTPQPLRFLIKAYMEQATFRCHMFVWQAFRLISEISPHKNQFRGLFSNLTLLGVCKQMNLIRSLAIFLKLGVTLPEIVKCFSDAL